MVLSFSPLLGQGHVWNTHMLIAAVPKHGRARLNDVETLDAVFAALVDDFGKLFAGCLEDYSPMFGGYFFVIWVLCGDLEYFGNELKMAHFNSNSPCWLCRANRNELNIRDVSRLAPWKETLVEEQSAPSPHIIWTIPGLHRHHVPGDAMHIIDCNGVAHFLGGSVLWQLASEEGIGNNMDERIAFMWGQCRAMYVTLGVEQRIGRITKEMVKPDANSWACLGSSIKAAAARHLIPVLLQVCRQMYTGNRAALHRICALQCLSDYYNLVEMAPIVPSNEDGDRALDLGERFLLHYNYLADTAQQEGLLLYPCPPKLHFFWHVTYQTRWLNPRSHCAYSHESFVGKIGTAASAVMHGTSVSRLSKNILENYLHVLMLRWQPH